MKSDWKAINNFVDQEKVLHGFKTICVNTNYWSIQIRNIFAPAGSRWTQAYLKEPKMPRNMME